MNEKDKTWPIIIISAATSGERERIERLLHALLSSTSTLDRRSVWSTEVFLASSSRRWSWWSSWWWKSRVHMSNDHQHDNVRRYKRIVVSCLRCARSNTHLNCGVSSSEDILIGFSHDIAFLTVFIACPTWRRFLTLVTALILFSHASRVIPFTASINERNVYFTNWPCDCFLFR